MRLLKNKCKQPDASTRDALLAAAKTVFANHGFEGASVRQIAELAGVNIAAISYHFSGKEGLYRACLESPAREGGELFDLLLHPAASATDFRLRLQLFIEGLLNLMQKDHLVLQIVDRDCHGGNPFATETFTRLFGANVQKLELFLEDAKKQAILSPTTSTELAAMVVMGCIHSLKRHDVLLVHLNRQPLCDEAHRSTTIRDLVAQICDGILGRPE